MEYLAESRPPETPGCPSDRGGLAAAAVTALILAGAVQAGALVLYWIPVPKQLWGDEITYLNAAQRLLATGTAGLDLLWPPLYPHFLAGMLVAAGRSLLAIQLAQLALLTLSAMLLGDFAAHLTGSRVAGNLTALLLLLDPTFAAFATYLWPEVLHTFLFLTVLWVLVLRADRPAWLGVGGIALGLALLTKSLLGPFTPILLLPLLSTKPLRTAVARVALVVAAATIVVAPVLVTNGIQHGVWVVSDSARFNAWVGLIDDSRKSFVRDPAGREYQVWLDSASDFSGRNRALAAKIRDLISQRGALQVIRAQFSRQYFRLFDRDSFLTDQLPGGILHDLGFGYRATAPWLANASRGLAYAHYGLLLVAAAAGVFLFPPRHARAWVRVVLAFLAFNLLLFLLLHVKSRYRLQFVPFLDLFAASALAGLWNHTRSSELLPITWPRTVAWAASALALLFLAFGGSWFPD